MRCSGGSTLMDRCCLTRLASPGEALGLAGVGCVDDAKRGALPALGLAEPEIVEDRKRGDIAGPPALGLVGPGFVDRLKRGTGARSPAALGLAGGGVVDDMKAGARAGSPAPQNIPSGSDKALQTRRTYDTFDACSVPQQPEQKPPRVHFRQLMLYQPLNRYNHSVGV